ncbi:MAG: dTMP kinase [Thermodesulfovibrionia bacterium]|nr:dTMP kinase [Thermodesulfovibrionia bacterium]
MSASKKFISFEGTEGSGKSTQASLLAEHLRKQGHDVILTAEPGGTRIGQKIRKLLLEPENHMDPLTELLLYYADRAQHIREVIDPALEKGSFVITDRFADSTVAYQGFARGVDLNIINPLNQMVVGHSKPSLTFILDIDVEEGLRRNRQAQKEDRFELEAIEFHNRVRSGYLEIAEDEPERVRVIDASSGQEDIRMKIIEIVEKIWPSKT